MSDEPERFGLPLTGDELDVIVNALTALLVRRGPTGAGVEPELYDVAIQLRSRLGQVLSNLREIPEGDDDEKIGVG